MRKYIVLSVLLNTTIFCSGQSILTFIDSLETKKYILEVKQLDQFIKRFNNEEDIFTGKEKSQEEISIEKRDTIAYQTYRKQTLFTLFNFKDTFVLNNYAFDFINYVGNDSNNVSISYYDAEWYAVVSCQIIYKGKNHNIALTLKNEGNNRAGFKWIIAGVNADFINITAFRTDSTKFISPMNHELGFMDLQNVFSDSKNITEYTSKKYSPDNLSIFLFLIKSGEIKYTQVNSIKYHFLQVKNWIFSVEHFNRQENNAGWLISNLARSTENDKLNYKSKVLFLK